MRQRIGPRTIRWSFVMGVALFAHVACDKETHSTPADQTKRQTSVGETTRSAADILAGQLLSLEERSAKALAEKPCASEELARCAEIEREEDWAAAGMCYMEAPPWVELTATVPCKAHHDVKAGANLDRAGLRQQATAKRMEAFQALDDHAGGDAMALMIDRADFLALSGDTKRARRLYAVYMAYADQDASAPATVVAYVQGQCRKTGGSCELEDEISDEELADALDE